MRPRIARLRHRHPLCFTRRPSFCLACTKYIRKHCIHKQPSSPSSSSLRFHHEHEYSPTNTPTNTGAIHIHPSAHLSPIKQATTDTMAETHTYDFDITMTCGGCSGAIDRVLKKLQRWLAPLSLPWGVCRPSDSADRLSPLQPRATRSRSKTRRPRSSPRCPTRRCWKRLSRRAKRSTLPRPTASRSRSRSPRQLDWSLRRTVNKARKPRGSKGVGGELDRGGWTGSNETRHLLATSYPWPGAAARDDLGEPI